MLTRLNAIDGVVGSFAVLANDGNRMVQIKVRPGAKAAKVVEEVQKALRAEVQHETPVQLEGKSAAALRAKQDWLTIGQLKELAATEESSSRRFDMEYWLLAALVFLALGAFLYWLHRRRRIAQQKSEVQVVAPGLPIAAS